MQKRSFQRLAVAAVALGAMAGLGRTASADLLVTDRYGDRVMRFSSVDGSLIDPDFIANDGTLNSAMEVLPVEVGGTTELWIADQNNDAVFRYTTGGSYIGTVVDSSNNIDNIRGFEVVGNRMYLTNFGTQNGAPGAAVRTFDISDVNNVVDLGSSAAPDMRSPWDIHLQDGALVVTDDTNISINAASDTGAIYSFDLDGNYTSTLLTGSRATNGLSLPKGMSPRDSTGELLVANNGSPEFVFEFDSTTGSIVVQYDTQRDDDPNTDLSANDAIELDNGLIFMAAQGTGILTTNGLYTIDPTDGTITPILIGADQDNTSFDARMIPHFVTYIDGSAIPEPASLALLAGGGMLLLRRRK